jgi:CubicO group peptidase (beta-lactamase class C family)
MNGLLAALLLALVLLPVHAVADDAFALAVSPDADRAAGFRSGTVLRLNTILEQRPTSEGITGIAAAIRRDGRLVFSRAVGTDGRGNPVRRDTLFDVASLTKQIAGIPAALLTMEKEEDFRGGEMPLKALLSHRSGLPESIPVEELEARGFEGAIASATPLFPVYAADRYSNAAYMELARRAHARHGEELERLIRRHFWKPLGMERVTWRPDPWLPIAATGYDTAGELLAGRPFDPAADWMLRAPGVPPPLHSGLFCTADDAALFYERLLAPGADAPVSLKAASALLYGAFTSAPVHGSPGRLRYRNDAGLESASGWPLAPADAATGRFVYQTGYTGCIAWVDRAEGIVVVILSNATLTDANEEFLRLRDAFIRAVIANTVPLP